MAVPVPATQVTRGRFITDRSPRKATGHADGTLSKQAPLPPQLRDPRKQPTLDPVSWLSQNSTDHGIDGHPVPERAGAEPASPGQASLSRGVACPNTLPPSFSRSAREEGRGLAVHGRLGTVLRGTGVSRSLHSQGGSRHRPPASWPLHSSEPVCLIQGAAGWRGGSPGPPKAIMGW